MGRERENYKGVNLPDTERKRYNVEQTVKFIKLNTEKEKGFCKRKKKSQR